MPGFAMVDRRRATRATVGLRTRNASVSGRAASGPSTRLVATVESSSRILVTFRRMLGRSLKASKDGSGFVSACACAGGEAACLERGEADVSERRGELKLGDRTATLFDTGGMGASMSPVGALAAAPLTSGSRVGYSVVCRPTC